MKFKIEKKLININNFINFYLIIIIIKLTNLNFFFKLLL